VAEQAVKYANDLLRGRSCNRSEDLAHIMLEIMNRKFVRLGDLEPREAVLETLNPITIDLEIQRIYSSRQNAIEEARQRRKDRGDRLNSAAIIRDKIGNCFEHAVLACHYINSKNIPNYLVETDDSTNHCFVVVGAPGGLGGQTTTVTKTAAGVLASAFTVVCDPWYHEWFSVQQDWGHKMWHIFDQTTKTPPTWVNVPLTFTDGGLVT
jgi:predicted RNA-binding Zn ribbon-like protein